MRKAAAALVVVSLIGITACGQPTRAPTAVEGSPQLGQAEEQVQGSPGRTLTMAIRYETVALAPKIVAGGQGVQGTLRLFNAQLSFVDGQGATRPYLAEWLPQLNTDTWRVLSDGKMDVVYTLRSGLTWHDGQPLTADDFVFSHRAYTVPGLGLFAPTPQNLMERVEARDPRTFVIHWRSLYPDAATFRLFDFEPLARHILEAPLARFEQDPAGQIDLFRNLPYWTQEYIGAGPFQLERWDPGSQLDAVAFAGHALGRPRLDRLTIRLFADENTVLSNMLSETIDVALDFTLRYEHAQVLLSSWEASKRGVVLLARGPFNQTHVQHRPDFQKTPALLDVRVRQALAHTIDRDTLNEALFDGRGFMAETKIASDARFYPQLERAMSRYPYDPRRAELLMGEAGFAKDAGGFFGTAQGERFRPDFWVIQGAQFERQQAIMHDTWTRAGIDTNPRVMGTTQLRDFEAAATVSGLLNRLLLPTEASLLAAYTSAQIGSPANRWLGSNRGGWSNPEYDQLFDAYQSTLERSERDGHIIEMMKLASVQVPDFPMYFNIEVIAHLASVRGPAVGDVERLVLWNVHEWEAR